MTDQDIVHSLQQFSRQPDSAFTGALIISRIVDPETDADWCRSRLQELVDVMPDDPGASDIVLVLQAQGFRGSESYYKSENSALTYVLSSREGIPISLAVVILGVCERLGVNATGVNFPSHFLVAIDDTLVDPFTMTLADPGLCQQWLERNGLDPATAFIAANPRDIVLRMLNNLSGLARSAGDPARALELSDYKLALVADALPLYLERVELWKQLGVVEMARRDLNTAIGLAGDEATREGLMAQLLALEDLPSRLN